MAPRQPLYKRVRVKLGGYHHAQEQQNSPLAALKNDFTSSEVSHQTYHFT